MSLLRLRILIIDDDPLFRELFLKRLGNAGSYDISVYGSAVDCILQETVKPDVIFIDYRMKDMDGISASKVLKRRWRGTQIVLISSSTNAVKSVLGRSRTIRKAYDKSVCFEKSIKEVRWIQLNRILKISAMVAGLILIGASCAFP